MTGSLSPRPSAFAYATARLAQSRCRVRETDVSLKSSGRKRTTLMNIVMYYVYILQSINQPEHFYVGYTSDLKKRLADHNSGYSIHTNKFKPWRVYGYSAFDSKEKAEKFEAFLKSGNGRIFQKKYF